MTNGSEHIAEPGAAGYTPTTAQIRDLVAFGARKAGESAQTVGADVAVAETLAMFDRWLAELERTVAARTLSDWTGKTWRPGEIDMALSVRKALRARDAELRSDREATS